MRDHELRGLSDEHRVDDPDAIEELARFVDLCAAGAEEEVREVLADRRARGGDGSDPLLLFDELRWLVEERPVHLPDVGGFEVRREIGRGSFGVVYEAVEAALNRPVALKVLHPVLANDRRAVSVVRRDARVAARLNHPNIVRVHGAGIASDGSPYVNMELLEGATVRELIDARIADVGERERAATTPEERTKELERLREIAGAFAGAARGLQHAHDRSVVHRDLKPSNLVRGADGELRIIDFGLARGNEFSRLSETGERPGTPLYMSPEQVRGLPRDGRGDGVDASADALPSSTDIYSLGATLYEVCTLTPPVRSVARSAVEHEILNTYPPPVSELNPNVPTELESIVHKCLEKRVSRRFATAEALAQELERFARARPVETRPVSVSTRAVRTFWRVRRRVAIGGALGLVVLLSAVVLTERIGAQRERAREEIAHRWESLMENAREAILWEEIRRATADATVRSRFVSLAPDEEISLTDPVTLGGSHRLLDSYESRLILGSGRRGSPLDLAVATSRLAEAIELRPEEPDPYVLLARRHLLDGNVTAASREIERALANRPDYVPARVFLASLPQNATEVDAVGRWETKWREALDHEANMDWPRASKAYADAAALSPRTGAGEAEIELKVKSSLARIRANDESLLFEAVLDLYECVLRWPHRIDSQLLFAKACFLFAGDEISGRGDAVLDGLFERESEEDRPPVVRAIVGLLLDLGLEERADTWASRLLENAHSYVDLAEEAMRPPVVRAIVGTAVDVGRVDEVSEWVPLLGGDIDSVLLKAEVFSATGDHASALDVCEAALRLDPASERARYRRAEVFAALGRFENAKRDFLDVIGTRGEFAAAAHNNLGTLLHREGRLQRAARHYREAGPLPVARFNLGWIFHRQRRFDAAEKEYRAAIERGLDLAVIYHNLGPCLLKQEREDEAIEFIEQGLDLEEDYTLGWKNLATAHVWQEWRTNDPRAKRQALDRAVKACRKVAELEPTWDDAFYRLGEVEDRVGKNEQALASYRRSIEFGGPANLAYESLARLLLRTDAPIPIGGELRRQIIRFEAAEVARRRWSKTAQLLAAYRSHLPKHEHPISYASVDAEIDAPVGFRREGDAMEWELFELATAPSGEWTKTNFVSSEWSRVELSLAYGDSPDLDPDEDTPKTKKNPLGDGVSGVCLRRSFRIDQSAGKTFARIGASVGKDDGFVVYLNGHEVSRTRTGETWRAELALPAYAETSSEESNDGEVDWRWIELPALWLDEENVVAVYAATSEGDSSLYVDLKIERSPPTDVVAKRAARILDGLSGRSPEDPVVRYAEGRLAQSEGRHDEALAIFDPLVALGEGSGEPALRAAESLRALQRRDDAERMLSGALVPASSLQREIWREWRELVLADLRWTPEEILERVPPVDGSAPESYEDFLWVVGELAAGREIRINCAAGVDYDGEADAADEGAETADIEWWSRERFVHINGIVEFLKPKEPVPDPAIFQISRSFFARSPIIPGLSVPVPRGRYALVLYFVEDSEDDKDPNRDGRRRFDVLVEGKTELENFGAAREANFDEIVTRTIEVDVDDGSLDVDFLRRLGDPELAAFTIKQVEPDR